MGTETGFRIFNVSPFKKTCHHDFDESESEGGGVAIVEMLYRCNLLALVGGGSNPRFPVNKVMIWDDHQKKCIGEVKLPRECVGVRMRRDRIIAATNGKIYIFRFSDLEMLDFIETCANPNGLFAVCPSSKNMVLCCPGLIRGHVRVELQLDKSTRRSTFIPAHETDLEAMSLNFEGTRLATASSKGTLIRIFETSRGQKLRELRRGVDRAIIKSLCFDFASKYVCCCSDKGTVHVFNVTEADDEEDKKKSKNRSSKLSFMKGMLPKYFSSEWSFAKFRSGSSATCAFASDGSDELVLVSNGGRFQRAAFDAKGKWKTTDYHKIGFTFTDDDDEVLVSAPKDREVLEDEDSVVVSVEKKKYEDGGGKDDR